jgi:protein TonB
MTTASFYDRKGMNPRALTVVVLLHGAALTALILAKGPLVDRGRDRNPIVEWIDPVKPPPEPPKPNPQPKPEPEREHFTMPKRTVEFDFPKPPPLPPAPPWTGPSTGPVGGEGEGPVDPPPAPPPPPPPPPPQTQPARARANLASYVSDSDYPAAAIRSEEQGTTRFRLAVGPDGRVSECTVTGSSGSSALDAATCRIMKQRARFTPARDGTGNPTADTVANAIKWVLPEG